MLRSARDRLGAVSNSPYRVNMGGLTKTAGYAFDGSNPSPATTCGNGSASCVNVAMRAVSFVQACVTLSRRGPACCGGHGYMTDGVRRVGAVCWAIGPTVNTAARGLGDLGGTLPASEGVDGLRAR